MPHAENTLPVCFMPHTVTPRASSLPDFLGIRLLSGFPPDAGVPVARKPLAPAALPGAALSQLPCRRAGVWGQCPVGRGVNGGTICGGIDGIDEPCVFFVSNSGRLLLVEDMLHRTLGLQWWNHVESLRVCLLAPSSRWFPSADAMRKPKAATERRNTKGPYSEAA